MSFISSLRKRFGRTKSSKAVETETEVEMATEDTEEIINVEPVEEPEEELMDMTDKMILPDLPDEMILAIAEYLDFPIRLKLRVNKKLGKLLNANPKHLERIEMLLCADSAIFSAKTAKHSRSGTWEDVDHLKRLLTQWSVNTRVDIMNIKVRDPLNERTFGVIDALFQFTADQLYLGRTIPSFSASRTEPLPLSFATLRIMAENIRDVTIGFDCISIDAMDLCIIRNVGFNMVKGGCNLESFMYSLSEANSFSNTCFGVTIDRGHNRSLTFHTTKNDLQFYLDKDYESLALVHVDIHFLTKMECKSNEWTISFSKLDHDAMPSLVSNMHKINWSVPYMYNRLGKKQYDDY